MKSSITSKQARDFIARWKEIREIETEESRKKSLRERFALMVACFELACELGLVNRKKQGVDYYYSSGNNWQRLKKIILDEKKDNRKIP